MANNGPSRPRRKGVSLTHPAGQYDELQVLYTISDTISTNLDLDDVFRKIIQLVEGITKADACLLYLLMDDQLVLRASRHPHPEAIGKLKLKIGEGITGWVAQHQRPVVIQKKAYDDPRFRFFQELPEDRYEAFISVPLFFRDTVIGVLNVQHRLAQRYPDHILNLLLVVGRQVGGAIENARMLEGTKSLKSVLATRKFIDHAKDLISKKLNVSAEEAYNMLLRQGAKTGKSVRVVAESMMIAEDLEK